MRRFAHSAPLKHWNSSMPSERAHPNLPFEQTGQAAQPFFDDDTGFVLSGPRSSAASAFKEARADPSRLGPRHHEKTEAA
jgi:hypothetical protein